MKKERDPKEAAKGPIKEREEMILASCESDKFANAVASSAEVVLACYYAAEDLAETIGVHEDKHDEVVMQFTREILTLIRGTAQQQPPMIPASALHLLGQDGPFRNRRP